MWGIAVLDFDDAMCGMNFVLFERLLLFERLVNYYDFKPQRHELSRVCVDSKIPVCDGYKLRG